MDRNKNQCSMFSWCPDGHVKSKAVHRMPLLGLCNVKLCDRFLTCLSFEQPAQPAALRCASTQASTRGARSQGACPHLETTVCDCCGHSMCAGPLSPSLLPLEPLFFKPRQVPVSASCSIRTRGCSCDLPVTGCSRAHSPSWFPGCVLF